MTDNTKHEMRSVICEQANFLLKEKQARESSEDEEAKKVLRQTNQKLKNDNIGEKHFYTWCSCDYDINRMPTVVSHIRLELQQPKYT